MKKPYYNQSIREGLKYDTTSAKLCLLKLAILKFRREIYWVFYPNEKRIPLIKYLAKTTPYQLEEVKFFVEKLREIDGDKNLRTWAIFCLGYCSRNNQSPYRFIEYYLKIRTERTKIYKINGNTNVQHPAIHDFWDEIQELRDNMQKLKK